MQNMSQKIVKIKTMRKKKKLLLELNYSVKFVLLEKIKYFWIKHHGKTKISRGEVSKPNFESHLPTEGCCK